MSLSGLLCFNPTVIFERELQHAAKTFNSFLKKIIFIIISCTFSFLPAGICVKVSDLLQELQAVMSCHEGVGN